ncbi:nicotinate phosphoribosyltransferase [Discoglossus pictus]
MEPYRGQLSLLTDLYQITMAYGYWNADRHLEHAEFELFFREPPFNGGFVLFYGLRESMRYLEEFKLTDDDVEYLRSVMPDTVNPAFFEYLKKVDASGVTVSAFQEGSVVFAREPLLKVTGPLLVVQLLETTLLCLVNYASLVGTNAARFRLAAGPKKKLVEMGLRRAQGPNGGFSASKYSYMGGFDGTSNVLAGRLCDIPVYGTVAHSYIASFSSSDEVQGLTLKSVQDPNKEENLLELSQSWLEKVCTRLKVSKHEPNVGELAAFVSYAISFPRNFLVVVDTYNVMKSGVPNFCAVALALTELGYEVKGVRLDSGDLAKQSVEIRNIFTDFASQFEFPSFKNVLISVSNCISEKNLKQLALEHNEIDMIGVGTHLVTCPLQPSLGCVYKLVQVKDQPRMKLSEDLEKMTIPGSKAVYRLYDRTGHPFLDLMALESEPPPEIGKELEFRELEPNTEPKKVTPIRAEPQHQICFQHRKSKCQESIKEIRSHAQRSLSVLSLEHKKLDDPQPYRVAVTEELHGLLMRLKGTISLQ